jgi:oligopeptidase B
VISAADAFPARRDVFRLIDRGFVYALAHPRGGGEMGRSWYEDGKFLKKKNTFKDFIACGEYLIKNKYVASNKLAACGGSAGGMLMGACINMKPNLFTAVAAHVPFVDVINTMFDKDLPLTQIEYKEWGNPADKKYYNYMKSYSPYDNVVQQDYPHLFVTCGLNDPRVTYWEPAKWVAKLRENKTNDSALIFKTNMGAGHFGVSGRFDHLWEIAEEYAFILKVFGLAKH